MLSNVISFFVGMYVAQEYTEVPNIKMVATKCMKELKKHLEATNDDSTPQNDAKNDQNKKK
jgi:hypothetical protein